jgi:hypothetical protein
MEPEQSKIFSSFPKSLTEAMSTEGTLIQSHDYAIGLDTWAKYPGVNQFLDIVQTDTWGDKEFVLGYEAKNYPIYGYMYHPEYQFTEFIGPGKWAKY